MHGEDFGIVVVEERTDATIWAESVLCGGRDLDEGWFTERCTDKGEAEWDVWWEGKNRKNCERKITRSEKGHTPVIDPNRLNSERFES